MIVDDEPSIIEAVTIYLEYEGYKVVPASSGYACLQQLREGFHGVILMDIVMPDLDGWSTIERIVEEGMLNGNAICMLTGTADPDSRGSELESYVLDYLVKPFDGEKLMTMVNTAASYLKP